MFGFIQKLFPQRVLVAISKPSQFAINYTDYTPSMPVSIRLYITGMKRSYEITNTNGTTINKKSQELDYWVDTGEFHDPTENDKFGWILSPRELKKKLLADLIAMEVD